MSRRPSIAHPLASTVLLAAVLALVLVPSLATSATYYASPSGGGSACSLGAPCLSLSTAIGKLSAGDTLYLRGGTYSEHIDTDLFTVPSGNSSARITIASYPGELARLTGGIVFNTGAGVSYVTFDGIEVDARVNDRGVYLGGSAANHHIRMIRMDIHGAQCNVGAGAGMVSGAVDHFEMLNSTIRDAGIGTTAFVLGCYGFYMTGSNGLYEGNEMYNNAGYAIITYHSGGNDVNNNIVRNNRIYNNGYNDGVRGAAAAGILMASGSNNYVYNNIVYGNGGPGIQVYATSSPNYVYNNTSYNNGKTGYAGCCYGGIQLYNAPGTVVRNNIVFSNGNDYVQDDGFSDGSTYLTNLCGTSGHGCDLTTSDPRFVNAGSGNFALQSNSPAIDAGTTLAAVATGFDGVVRPQGPAYDIGAYESATGATPLPAPTNLRLISQ